MEADLELTDISDWGIGMNSLGSRPLQIAGPCSAESEEQVLETARELQKQEIHLFRSGIWKPRSRPDSFEGIGEEGLQWLSRVKQEIGLPVTVEVARAEHVEKAIDYDIDVFWIGARTSANPFAVSEVARAIEGTDVPVLVKNPINPELKLWVGAIERIRDVGVDRIAAVHRGFSTYRESRFRNDPLWKLPIELKHRLNDLPVICDPSHICGDTENLQRISQKALDLEFDGLMIEVHPEPESALSDSGQQVTPDGYSDLIDSLIVRKQTTEDVIFRRKLRNMREEIDALDEQLIEILAERMEIVRQIGHQKENEEITILQSDRWKEIVKDRMKRAIKRGLNEEFINNILDIIHEEAIHLQDDILNRQHELQSPENNGLS